jgi:hypothetical protein
MEPLETILPLKSIESGICEADVSEATARGFFHKNS